MWLPRGRAAGVSIALATFALLLVSVSVRVVVSAARELDRGDHYRAAGELDAAVLHYRRAARWYAPGSPYHVRALAQLAAVGAAAEQRQDVELALSAQRAIRSAILSSRSFYTPEPERLTAANQRIASLMARQPAPPIDAGKSAEQLRQEHLSLLSAEPGPSVPWTAALLLGFGAWLGAVFALARRAVDDEDRIVPGELLRWGALAVVGFGLFALGLSMA